MRHVGAALAADTSYRWHVRWWSTAASLPSTVHTVDKVQPCMQKNNINLIYTEHTAAAPVFLGPEMDRAHTSHQTSTVGNQCPKRNVCAARSIFTMNLSVCLSLSSSSSPPLSLSLSLSLSRFRPLFPFLWPPCCCCVCMCVCMCVCVCVCARTPASQPTVLHHLVLHSGPSLQIGLERGSADPHWQTTVSTVACRLPIKLYHGPC